MYQNSFRSGGRSARPKRAFSPSTRTGGGGGRGGRSGGRGPQKQYIHPSKFIAEIPISSFLPW